MPSGDNMDSAQEVSSPEKEALAEEVMESLGEPEESGDDINQSHDSIGSQKNDDPLYVQKRLKQQKRAHNREKSELLERIKQLESSIPNMQSQNQSMNTYSPDNQIGGIDEQIHKAVSYALQHKEMEERKAKQAEQAAHVNRQYQDLQKHLDKMGDKYDDFDEVVLGNNVPITNAMRDASLLLPTEGAGSAGEVFYKLGKNPEELTRIAKLHPLEQARELNKLSRSLEIGGDKSKSSQPSNKLLGNIKSSPVTNSGSVTDKTSVSELRERMKAGWK
jgi:hypothetical protein